MKERRGRKKTRGGQTQQTKCNNDETHEKKKAEKNTNKASTNTNDNATKKNNKREKESICDRKGNTKR